jgi:hypothetical protein
MDLSYLGGDNRVYITREFLNVGFNTYIAKLNAINNFSKERFKGNIAL